MSTDLEQLNLKIAQAKERLSGLKNEVESLGLHLEQARAAEATAIMMQQPDIHDLRQTVMDLQAAILGTQRAWALQSRGLEILQADRTDELARIGQSEEPALIAEFNEIASEVYALITLGATRVSELKAKANELARAKEAQNKALPGSSSSAFSARVNQLERSLCVALEEGFTATLRYPFPKEIFAHEDLQAPEALRKTLKAGTVHLVSTTPRKA